MKRGGDKDLWFKFFSRDWLACTELRRCSLAARGAWVELICLIRMSGNGGRLMPDTPDGWTDEALAGLLAGDQTQATAAVAELRTKRVLAFDDDGALVSERAVEDSAVSAQRARAGKSGAASKWQTDGKPMATDSGFAMPLPSNPEMANGWQNLSASASTSGSTSQSGSSSDSEGGLGETARTVSVGDIHDAATTRMGRGTVYGTPEPPGFRKAVCDRWDAARAAGVPVGPRGPACVRLIPATLDEIANCPELDEAARADPPGFLLRQLDAYLSSREAKQAPLNRLGTFLRKPDGRRKWLETPEQWNHQRDAAKPEPEETVHDRIARQIERVANAKQ